MSDTKTTQVESSDSSSSVSVLLSQAVPDQTVAHVLAISAVLMISWPVFVAVIMSSQSTAQVLNVRYLFFGSSGISNYISVLTDWSFARLMLNTLLMAAITTVGSITVALFASLAIVYYDFPFKNLVFTFILFTLMVPIPVRIVPLYDLTVSLGWHDTLLGLTLPYLASAMSVFLLRQHFRSIPTSHIETAKLVGVGPLKFLTSVLIPMSKGMIAGLVVIKFIGAWNAYLWPLVAMTSREKQVVQVGLRYLQNAAKGGVTQWELLMAGSVILLIPPLIILVAMRRPLLKTFGIETE